MTERIYNVLNHPSCMSCGEYRGQCECHSSDEDPLVAPPIANVTRDAGMLSELDYGQTDGSDGDDILIAPKLNWKNNVANRANRNQQPVSAAIAEGDFLPLPRMTY